MKKRNEEYSVGENIYCSFFFDHAKEGTVLLEKELRPTPASRTIGTTTILGTFPKWSVTPTVILSHLRCLCFQKAILQKKITKEMCCEAE